MLEPALFFVVPGLLAMSTLRSFLTIALPPFNSAASAACSEGLRVRITVTVRVFLSRTDSTDKAGDRIRLGSLFEWLFALGASTIRVSELVSDSCAGLIIAALALVTRLIASGLSFSRGLMSETWRYNLAASSVPSGRNCFSR
jgi:hypothetical protein